jgi:excisionase family DNA binding protein
MEVPELLTMKQVCEKLKVSHDTIQRLMKDQKLAGTLIGGKWKFTPDAINAYIKSRTMKIKTQPA